MVQRILTALVLLPVAVALVLWAPPWLFFLGTLPFALLGAWEYLELIGRAGAAPARLPVYLVALAVLLVAASRPGELLAAVVGGSLLLFVASLLQRGQVGEIPTGTAASIFGVLYVVVPFALVIELRSREQGPWVLLYGLLVVWAGDTAAYFVGRGFGRHKLAPVLSPGKTVEGTVASLVATLAVGFWLFRAWFTPLGLRDVHSWLLPLAVNLAAQVGDVAESGLKRGAGVKDSSALLPGHGGVLDRVDGLLFALPTLWYYWSLVTRGGF